VFFSEHSVGRINKLNCYSILDELLTNFSWSLQYTFYRVSMDLCNLIINLISFDLILNQP